MRNRVSGTFRLTAAIVALSLLAAGCVSNEPTETTQANPGSGSATSDPSTSSTQAEELTGGTLRLASLGDSPTALDPQEQQNQFPFDLYACCILRNLVVLADVTPDGPVFVGDIAEDLPQISSDGLEYTFTLRQGVRFGPPVNRQVTSQDFINTFERALAPDSPSFDADRYLSIAGAEEYMDGSADSIAGLTAPDEQTLVITLTAPDPLFLGLLTVASASPIPIEVSENHDDEYGRFLVATGPYMIEGSDAISDLEQLEPYSGYLTGQALVLVRNPEWERSSDPLRGEGAYPDRIEVTIGGTPEDYAAKIEAGELDMQLDGNHPAAALRRWVEDPQLAERVQSEPFLGTIYATMAVAAPPFDDVHVRRAANLIVDKAAIQRIYGGEINGTIAEKIIPPGPLGGLNDDLAPFATDGNSGDLERAQAEMAQSAYDSDGDGICDAEACQGVSAFGPAESPGSDMAQSIAADFAEIGIILDLELNNERWDVVADPGNQVAFNVPAAWGTFPYDASDIALPVFGSGFIGPEACCNEALLGASPEQLDEWGFATESVPSVDSEIEACLELPLGNERQGCWAEWERMMMEEIVPWLVLLNETKVRLKSESVVQAPYSEAWSTFDWARVAVRQSG